MSSESTSGRAITRRQVFQRTAIAAGTLALGRRTWAARTTSRPVRFAPARPRPDLLPQGAPSGLEILQLTAEPQVPSSHVYMESQIFTPDSKRFVLHRSAHPHGSDRKDPEHQYLLCDIEDRFSLSPLTDEIGATGPSVSPDGKYLYYFVDETRPRVRRLSLKRVGLDGTGRETLIAVDGTLPDTNYRPSKIYPLSTISADGRRVAISGFLGDGVTPNPPWGLMVFDVEKASVRLVLQGPTWSNMHPQYCRSRDPEAMHDILIQENHDNVADPKGATTRVAGGAGADIHVVRDDGTGMRDLPWGRDGNEFCQGHQCWRGGTTWAITSTQVREPAHAGLIESQPVPHRGHIGRKREDGVRNILSREDPKPAFHHFATDIQGRRFVTDYAPFSPEGVVKIARLGTPGEAPLSAVQTIALPKSSGVKTAHTHPFLSPDGRMAFFNSDESGIVQAYAVRGLPT